MKVCLDANDPERTQAWCMVGFINSSLCNGVQLINPTFLCFWTFQMLFRRQNLEPFLLSVDKWGPLTFWLWARFANLMAQFKCPEFCIIHQSARVFVCPGGESLYDTDIIHEFVDVGWPLVGGGGACSQNGQAWQWFCWIKLIKRAVNCANHQRDVRVTVPLNWKFQSDLICLFTHKSALCTGLSLCAVLLSTCFAHFHWNGIQNKSLHCRGRAGAVF